ncbi:hypothetical protein EX30DRAFT_343915 [Ascodesmis nigricans]|uniref:Uncharacterized protein n=1 Tax=Ascodesmis nigricans TaxID=341454 RepID=A0A4S2MQR0_9PEZI|nr:hypothetical protein EX30DRAFT_343915 [Ascodesmis nigricans]
MRLLTLPTIFLTLLTLSATAQDLPDPVDPVPSPTPPSRAERCYNRCLTKRLVNCPDPEIYTVYSSSPLLSVPRIIG